MKKYTREDIVRLVQDEDVEFIRLQFTDIPGMFKNVAVTASQLKKALDNRCVFDSASITGFHNEGEAQLFLHPDCDTFEIFPWRPQQGKVARLICDVCHEDGAPFAADPRHILKKAASEARGLGYTMEVSPECEFFLFHSDEKGLPTTLTHEQAGYFDMSPLDLGENARRDIVMMLEDMGFEIESSHHESAPAQHEVDFRRDEALKTADNIMTFKLAVKTIAKRHGLHATFMPKPKNGVEGSGMHLRMALLKDGKNIFTDENKADSLSREGLFFVGGLMKHIKGMTAVTNPIVNSYKRLVSGYEAPVCLSWDTAAASPLVRVIRDREEGTRIELRSPDSAANPYLALALCLRAGLDGIREQIMPSQEPESRLPSTLREALHEMERDSLIGETLGRTAYENYLMIKGSEWETYQAQVSEWEIRQYLNRY